MADYDLISTHTRDQITDLLRQVPYLTDAVESLGGTVAAPAAEISFALAEFDGLLDQIPLQWAELGALGGAIPDETPGPDTFTQAELTGRLALIPALWSAIGALGGTVPEKYQ